MRIEPPPSVPSATGPQPLATATAAPPLEPPGVSAGFHGFFVTPKRGFSVMALWPNSDVLVFPRTSAPAARRRATAIASSSGTWSAKSREPPVVVSPRVKRTSLIETGTPWSGPSGSPFVTAISASRAAARACSAATTQNAFSTGLIASIRDRTASVTSIGESFLARTRPEISRADCQISIDCSHCIILRRAVLRSSRPPRERARLGQRRLARARAGAAPRRHVARDRAPRDDGGAVGARGSPVARGTISGRRRPAGRAPHRLRSARLGAHRSHPTARRTHALAARWRHRRAESDRRARAEKVVFRGAAYYRPDWQSVVRQAPKRVRDVPEGVLCSLWALGRPVEDHLLLASEGDLLRVLEPVVHECPARPMPPEVVGGVAAIVAAGSARPLAPVIEDVARAVALEWGAVARDLVTIGADRIRVSEGFRAALAERLATAHGRGPRATLALAAIVELGVLVGDALRARAQAQIGRAHV